MTRLLSLFGLMRVSEHEREIKRSDGWLETTARELNALEAKYKQAVADLEKQAGEIAALKRDYARRGELIQEARNERDRAEAEAKSLRPDALAMRRKRQMDRDRRKGNG